MNFFKPLFNQRGEVSEGGAAAAAPAAPASNGSVDFSKMSPGDIMKGVGSWQRFIPEDMIVDYQGHPELAKNVPFFKEPKEFKDFAKTAYEAHREFGSRVKIPAKDSKPEELSAFQQKVREAGIYVPKPYPEAADKYEIKPPEGWENDPKATETLRAVAYKHGIPQEALNDLLGVHYESVKEIMPHLNELKTLVPALKQTKEEGEKELATFAQSEGLGVEDVKAVIGRYAAKRFGEAKIALLGDYGNNPIVLQMLYENAKASGEDFRQPLAEDVHVDSEVEKEIKEIQTPGSEKNKKWVARGPEGDQMRARLTWLFQQTTGGK